jgi:hypothetical protein
MTILEASMAALETDELEKSRMMDEWTEEPNNRMGLALFIKDTISSEGHVTLKTLAFIFLFGVQTGMILERSKNGSITEIQG